MIGNRLFIAPTPAPAPSYRRSENYSMANHYSEVQILSMSKAQRRQIPDLPTPLEPGIGCSGCGAIILTGFLISEWLTA